MLSLPLYMSLDQLVLLAGCVRSLCSSGGHCFSVTHLGGWTSSVQEHLTDKVINYHNSGANLQVGESA
jgi:hypothetical protein